MNEKYQNDALKKLSQMEDHVKDLGWEIKIINKDIKEIKNMIKNETVPKDRYSMVEKIVFGLVGLALIALATTIINGALIR